MDTHYEERFIRDYVYERAKEFMARHDSSGIIWQSWHDRAEVQLIVRRAAERRKKLREQGEVA